jgi:membrane protease YdiL (CAAX protease family)
LSAIVPETTHDKIFVGCLIVAGVTGLAFSLGSVGYILGFNATTLMMSSIFFTVLDYNWIRQAKPPRQQAPIIALAAIPIAARWFMNMPLFNQLVADLDTASVSALQQLGYVAQVIGLWVLVAVCEEAFRAAMMNAAMAYLPMRLGDIQLRRANSANWGDMAPAGKAAALVFSTLVWLAFHFFQRPLDLDMYWPYMIWLFISGMVMGYALVEGGLGASVPIHIIVNLTA